MSEAVPGLTAKHAASQLILEAVQSGGQPVSVPQQAATAVDVSIATLAVG